MSDAKRYFPMNDDIPDTIIKICNDYCTFLLNYIIIYESGKLQNKMVQNTIFILFWSILGRFGQLLSLTLAYVSEIFPPILPSQMPGYHN